MRRTLLTVDDSRTVRTIVHKALRGYDCVVLDAGNGAEGLVVAAREKPDLILLDVTMPVMDGITMLMRLKADPALRAIPVLMLTTVGAAAHDHPFAGIEVSGSLVKPFKEEALVEKVRGVLELTERSK